MTNETQEQSGTSQLAEAERGRFDCPLCGTEQARWDGTRFCLSCGVPVIQPCPKCRRDVDTERTRASSCPHCREPLWKCQKCYRYYRLHQLACVNDYCESKGVPWTSLEGKLVWSHPGGDLARTNWGSDQTPQGLLPWWQWTAPGEVDLHAPVNALGMVVCASRGGQVWCLAEVGTEATSSTPGEYECSPIEIYDLNLGSAISAGPVIQDECAWVGLLGGEVVQLDLLTGKVHYHATSLGGRIDFLLPCPRGLLAAGPTGVALVDTEGTEHHFNRLPPGADVLAPVGVGAAGTAALVVGWNRDGRFQSIALKHGKEAWEPVQALDHPVEHLVGGERLYMVSRTRVRVLAREGLGQFELSDPLAAPPAFDPESDRLVLCLTDQSVRTYGHDGTRVSFRSALAGTPTGPPLLLGHSVLYGTEERFLCLSERTASPRLGGRVHPRLSIANGRVFCTTERGGVYAFGLEP